MGNAFRGLLGSKPRNLACSDDDALCLCPGDTLMLHERTSILGDVQSIQGPSLISFTHACLHQIIIRRILLMQSPAVLLYVLRTLFPPADSFHPQRRLQKLENHQ